ncbi:MAG: sigma-70 family RNA polymerase sigma factor [Phaeodactylibacter sp.]|nr:sigma-70 family RNA polymerase sigma factor [Phaeodactylibacter sp.]
MLGYFLQKEVDFGQLARRLEAVDTEAERAALLDETLAKLLRALPAPQRKSRLLSPQHPHNPYRLALNAWAEGQPSDGQDAGRSFHRHLDQQYLSLLCSGSNALRQACENLLAEQYSALVDTKASRQLLRSREARADAFCTAFSKFIGRLRSPGWEWTQAAALKTIFEKMLHDECINMVRRQSAFKNRNTILPDEQKMTEILRAWNIRIDPELKEQALMQLRQADPLCFSLIDQHHQGYSYEELEPAFGKTAGQLRRMAYNCREKLQQLWQALTK